MHEVSVTREINAPKRNIWQALDDFGGVAKYNPGVAESRIVAGPDTGEGATRECLLNGGGRIEEEIIDYEPGSAYTVEFVDMGEFPLKENIVDISVTELGDSWTEVTMAARFTLTFGSLGWLMAKLVMKSKFEGTFAETLDGLASYVETGQHEHDEVESAVVSD